MGRCVAGGLPHFMAHYGSSVDFGFVSELGSTGCPPVAFVWAIIFDGE